MPTKTKSSTPAPKAPAHSSAKKKKAPAKSGAARAAGGSTGAPARTTRDSSRPAPPSPRQVVAGKPAPSAAVAGQPKARLETKSEPPAPKPAPPPSKPAPPASKPAPAAEPAEAATSAPTEEALDANGVKKKSPSAELAAQIVAGTTELGLPHYARSLEHENPNTAAQAARIVEEVVLLKPELAAPHIERLVRLLASENPRVVQACAMSLPLLTKVAPAKVARHLERLRDGYDAANEVAKDGTVRIFVALCIASVAYQKRVIDVLERALLGAEPKTLQRWTELVLPALKGEPHAQARAVVEQRLNDIPRPQAEKIAEFLGIRLRPVRPA